MSALTEKLANLPSRPGVYLMRDKAGKVIYVGKAKDLRARVRAYFNNADERSQIQFLVRRDRRHRNPGYRPTTKKR